MKRALIVPAVLADAALDELKEWLAISTPREDAALTALLRTALETCEGFTGLMPLAAECEEMLPALTAWQALATRPIQAVTGVEGLSAGGTRFSLPADDYAIELDAEGGAMVRIVRRDAAERIVVRFTAGMAADWAALPDALRHGVLRLAAHHYRQRDADSARAMPPAAVAALWRPWRRLRVA
jgi:uncharacterized phiE125 gp8 family phage protein